MKNTFIFFFLMLSLYACKPDSESVEIIREPWEGKWNLVSATYGLAGGENFATGAITWTFDANHDVDVRINVPLGSNTHLPLEQNGIYNCPINSAGDKITINNHDYGFSIQNGVLFVDGGMIVDGPGYRFERD